MQVPQAGDQLASAHACQRMTSAFFLGSSGRSVCPGFFEHRYRMIASDSHSTKSPSVRVGITPLGLSFRYSGERCWPLLRSTISTSCGIWRCWATNWTLRALGDGGKT